MDNIILDFEQARAKHILFKSRLRSILYGIELDEAPVVSHFECNVGKWIYSHALKTYGHIPEMLELERVHASIHIVAKKLIEQYRAGKIEDARRGLSQMEIEADQLVSLLKTVEAITKDQRIEYGESSSNLAIRLEEFHDILKTNIELDIKIKKQVKETEIAKERFELLAKATQDAVWDWDLKTDKIWWSDGYQNLFGYKKENIEPGIESWYNYIHFEDRERVLNDIHSIIDYGGTNWSSKYRFTKADGSYAFVFDRGYCLHDHDGKPYRMVGSMVDITVSVLAERALIESEKRFLFMSETIPQKFFTATPDGSVDYFNPQWTDFTGLSIEEIKEWGWIQFIHPDDVEENIRKWKYSVETGTPFEIEHRFRSKDGSYRWHLSRARPLRDEKDNIIMWSGSNTDIDDQKRNEHRKDEFISVASHELKTPMTSLKGFLQIIQKQASNLENKSFGDLAAKANRQIDKLSTLINDLLDVTKIHSGKLQLSYSEFTIGELIQDCIEQVQFIKPDYIISVQGQTDLLIKADRLRLEQVLINYLTNAIKYSADDRVIISAAKDGYDLKVEVIDFGIGIPEEKQQHLFGRFFRVEESSKYAGLGLGLYICKEIISRHHGSVGISSALGKGSTFWFKIPV